MQYRRAIVPGGTFFFTLVTQNRRPLLANPVATDCLRSAFREVKAKRQFMIDAIVIMPDHLHCIWTLPEGDGDRAVRWRLVKTWVTKHWSKPVPPAPTAAHRARGEQGLWQNRYWEHCIRNDEDFARHVDYVHFNPVKHGYVSAAGQWPWSSFRRWVKLGLYPDDWGCDESRLEGIGHE